jgi:fermentation-respiration switch protein FrsA (DUF1100 family)
MRRAASETTETVPQISRRRRIARLAWRIVRTPLVVYFGIVILFMWFENSLIYFPSKYPEGDWTPWGVEFEDAQFRAADGTQLHGWYVPVENPSAVVLFCHGNGGNLTHRADLMQAMQEYVGATILVFDYRGYGKSEGEPDEPGVVQDARAARAWLAERTGVSEKEIVLMGESLGGAVAVDLAASDGARGLILEDTFTSLGDMAAYHYPWLPAKWLMKSRFDSLGNIGRYHGPLLMTHGDSDTIVPISYARRLFDAANPPKQFVTDHGADHNDPRPIEFYDTLRSFLADLPPVE